MFTTCRLLTEFWVTIVVLFSYILLSLRSAGFIITIWYNPGTASYILLHWTTVTYLLT